MKAIGWFCGLCLLSLAEGLPVAASGAENDLSSKMVNDPTVGWYVFGDIAKGVLIEDKTVTGGTAERVTVSAAGLNPWDAGGVAANVKPVASGDVLLLAFWAKAVEPPPGLTDISIFARLQETAAPYTSLGPQENLHLTGQWKLYYVRAVAAKDYGRGQMGGSLSFATGVQTFDLGPILLLDFGQGFDLNKLPVNH